MKNDISYDPLHVSYSHPIHHFHAFDFFVVVVKEPYDNGKGKQEEMPVVLQWFERSTSHASHNESGNKVATVNQQQQYLH
jgi:hypothetical protein